MAADDTSRGGDPGQAGGTPPAALGFDTSVAHPARIWDYFLGGKDNFAADRAAAKGVLEVMPSMKMVARAGRAHPTHCRQTRAERSRPDYYGRHDEYGRDDEADQRAEQPVCA